jgi:hypothetical protein
LLHVAYHCTPTAPHTSSPCMLNFFAIKQILLSPLPTWNFDFQNRLLRTCNVQVKSKNFYYSAYKMNKLAKLLNFWDLNVRSKISYK